MEEYDFGEMTDTEITCKKGSLTVGAREARQTCFRGSSEEEGNSSEKRKRTALSSGKKRFREGRRSSEKEGIRLLRVQIPGPVLQ